MNLDELYKARYVLNGIIRRTDLVQAPRLNPDALVEGGFPGGTIGKESACQC